MRTITGKSVEWESTIKLGPTCTVPAKGAGIVHAIGHESAEDTWQDFMALVEMPCGRLLGVPVHTSNMRVVDRAAEPPEDANARETWAELQRLRRVLLSFGRDNLSSESFYSPEDVLSKAWQELGRLRNRDGTLGRIAAELGMEYVSDNTISDNRDLRVYRAVMELKEGKPQEPRPMSEAPRDGTMITIMHQVRFEDMAWRGRGSHIGLGIIERDAIGWLPASGGEDGS